MTVYMRKGIATFFILACMMLAAQAHEFWLQAKQYFLRPGDNLLVQFMVGENFMGEPWNLKRHTIEILDLYEAGTKRSIVDSVQKEQGFLQVKMKTPGTKMLVLQSNNAFVELTGDKFNAYLKEGGLDEVFTQREKTQALQKAARELYSRHTKLLVQVGDKLDDVYKREIGLPIEIIPEKNPYSLKQGDTQKFLILFEGKPLFGAKVKLWNRFNNRTTIQNIYTEQNGMIEMRVSNPGPWMVSIVKMVASKDPKADWQSYWGTLVFGVK